MKKLISAKLAGNVLLTALALLLVFHILVLAKVLPAGIVWGGQAKGVETNLMLLEGIALLATLLFILIAAAKTGYLHAGRWSAAVNLGMWLIFAFMLLNLLGNLTSQVSFENLVAAPLTVILAFVALRLAIEK